MFELPAVSVGYSGENVAPVGRRTKVDFGDARKDRLRLFDTRKSEDTHARTLENVTGLNAFAEVLDAIFKSRAFPR